MAERDVVDEPAYYFKGYVGVPIELELLSEEGRQKLIDNKTTRDDIKVITQLMDDPRATGKFTGDGAIPPTVDGDRAIFYFYAAMLQILLPPVSPKESGQCLPMTATFACLLKILWIQIEKHLYQEIG
jgi:hypothetical protein